jgi:hypothetical protein
VVDIHFKKRFRPGESNKRFINDTGYFKHPSAVPAHGNTLVCRQGDAKRAKALLIEVGQWTFPDTEDSRRQFGDG